MTIPEGARPLLTAVRAVAVQFVLLVLAGFLIVHPPFGLWDPREPAVDRWLAGHRSHRWTTVSSWASAVGFTPAITAVTAGACVVLLAAGRGRRWREAGLLAGAVCLQALVFVPVAAVVHRDRPEVVRLDGALPTSSFPSGHVGAATALYGGLGLIALLLLRGRWRTVLCALAWAVPLLVAASRLYRGMHHPTDVLAGLLNGAAALWVMRRAMLPSRPASAERRPVRSGGGAAAVVYNPVVVDRARLLELREVLAVHGHPEPLCIATVPDDPGRSAAERALRSGATLVVACGGDGTVTACAEALADTGAVLAVAPCGTGNLLARNLGLPTDPSRALANALEGAPRRIDLVRVEGDGLPDRTVAAMAGLGTDAAVMADTKRSLKRRLGWPAYALAAVRHLGDRQVDVSVTVDGGPAVHRRASMAVVGNVGSLQGGVRLLPDVSPDDGALQAVLFHPRGLRGWCAALPVLLPGRGTGAEGGPDAPFEYFRGRSIELTADRTCPRELDGDPVTAGRALRLSVRPGALLVQAPRPAGSANGAGARATARTAVGTAPETAGGDAADAPAVRAEAVG